MVDTLTHDVDERRRVLDAYARRPVDGRYDADRPDQIALTAARGRVWRACLERRRWPVGTVLEVGCGTGAVARWAFEEGVGSVAHPVVGVDVQAVRLQVAKAYGSDVDYLVGDARGLPVPDASVEIAICSTLFSSVLDDDVARAIATELDRTVTPTGVVLWFDFFRRNPLNPDVRPVLPTDLARWFPAWTADLERVVLAPPIARRLDGYPRVAAALAGIPALRTHLAGMLTRKPAPQASG